MNKKKELLDSRNSVYIDSHTHAGVSFFALYHGLYPCMQNLDELAQKSKSNGIHWTIVAPLFDFYFSFYEMFQNKELIESGLQRAPFEVANKYLLDEVRKYGQNALPFLAIHPLYRVEEQCKKIYEWAKEFGIFGLKLFIAGMDCSVSDLKGSQFVDILKGFDLPLLVHCGREEKSSAVNILDFAQKYPDIRICAAHAGRFERDFWENIGTFNNVYVDVSPFLLLCKDTFATPLSNVLDLDYGHPFRVIHEIYQLIPFRLLWGTDEPFTKISRTPWSGKIEGGYGYEGEAGFFHSLPGSLKKNIALFNTKRFLGLL